MKKNTIPLSLFINAVIAVILCSNSAYTQNITPECIFYKGDSLKGFNLGNVMKTAKGLNLNTKEAEGYFRRQESEYVARKYNMPLMKSNVILPHHVTSVGCNNTDFETGDFTGWTGDIEENTSTTSGISEKITKTSIAPYDGGLNAAETACSWFTIVSSGTDPYSNLPMNDPNGGMYSCRLGGENANIMYGYNSSLCGTKSMGPNGGSMGELLTQTFNVTSANALFTYSYAVVINDANHIPNLDSFFLVSILDSAGNAVPGVGDYFTITAGVPPTGFIKSAAVNASDNTPVYYCPWTSKTVDLSQYIGHNITVEFLAIGCALGAHFCYAYIDCSCSSKALVTHFPCDSTTGTITAPSGESSYSWSGPGIVSGADTSAIKVNASGTYSVAITTSSSYTYTLDTTVTIGFPVAVNLTGNRVICPGIADTLIAGGGTTYIWSTGGTNDTIIVHPSVATTYSVAISNGTCAKDTSIVVAVNSSPVVSISGHAQHTCGNADTLTAHATGTGPFAYNWTSGSTDSIAPVMINTTYSVTVTDANSCTTTKSFAVHDSVPVIPICLVTVDSTSTKIIVIWNNPGANSGIDSLFLYRDSVSGPIAWFVPSDFSEFVDTTNGMDPNAHYYQYNLDGVDSCGQGSGGLTGYAKTIHLTVSPNGCGNILNWTKYSGYFTFTQYFIHRDSANMGWKTIDSVNSGTYTWTDANCYSAGSNISYYIDVKDNNVCQPSGHSKYANIVSSRSNSAKGSIITGVQQMVNVNTISIFPNPAASTTTIVFGSGGKHYVELDDITGRKIESIECNGKQYELSVNSLAKGIYFIRAYDEGMKYMATAKVVVQ